MTEKPRKRPRYEGPKPIFQMAREIMLSFPGVVEGTSYGTPGYKLGGKFLARLYEDGESLVLKVGEMEQQMLIAMEPEVYYITDHYIGSGLVLIRLANISAEGFRKRFEAALHSATPAEPKR